MTVLSDNKLLILAMGIVRGGILYAEDFYQIYSSDEAAISSIQSLRAWGFIRFHKSRTPGVFQVVRAPAEAFEIAENLRKEQESFGKR